MLEASPHSAKPVVFRSVCVCLITLLTACGGQSVSSNAASESTTSINTTNESDTLVPSSSEPVIDLVEPPSGNPLADEGEAANAEPVISSEEESADAELGNPLEDETADTEIDNPAAVDTNISEVVTTNFDITVPEYQSSELLVMLYYNEQSVQATYVAGQSWTATISLPKNTFTTVQVIFFDRNGELALAAAQLTMSSTNLDVQNIPARNLWFTLLDYDQDRTDNITELQQGTDPLISDSVRFPAEITYQDDDVLRALRTVTANYERQVPHNRPWSDSIVELPGEVEGDTDASRSFAVDIDSAGNGEYEFADSGGNSSSNVRRTGSAARSVVNNTVVWEGQFTRVTFPDDNTRATFRSETQRYSDLDFGQAGQLSNTNSSDCCLSGATDVEYSVIGSTRSSTNDGFCNVSYGWITVIRSAKIAEFFTNTPITTSYTRANALRVSNWRVRTSWNGVVFSDYELDYDEVSTQFYCDFGDL